MDQIHINGNESESNFYLNIFLQYIIILASYTCIIIIRLFYKGSPGEQTH